MPKKLKTFVTKSGFFEYAVAVPTKKAAMELLGVTEHDFQHHFASQTTDSAIVKTTQAKPGKVLCRPVGTYEKFSEHAKPPKIKISKAIEPAPKKESKAAKKKELAEEKKLARQSVKAAKTEAVREAKAEAARRRAEAREQERQEKMAVAYERAERRHRQIIQQLEAEREKIEGRLQKEEKRWEQEKGRLWL